MFYCFYCTIYNMGPSINIEEFRKIAEETSGIDINDLINKIEEIKGEKLEDKEKKYLCLILCQYSASEIAFIYYENRKPSRQEITQSKEKLKRKSKTLREYASKGLNIYLKELLGIEKSNPLPQFKNGELAKKIRNSLKVRNSNMNSEDEVPMTMTVKEKDADNIKRLLMSNFDIKFEQ